MGFHVIQVKYVDFKPSLIQHNAAAHAYASPRPTWFILEAMSALDHVIFIWFHFKKRNEMKSKKKKKKENEYESNENE